ncbi:granzyme A-like [Eublepharis macularius]|uniref:Granzyme A-like n=1 Tax=Eublepharis macularius TaxID=481883 RepID=A0AA97L5A4_EUBMA|nr:granzyme A-like [Eublepharis macularius]
MGLLFVLSFSAALLFLGAHRDFLGSNWLLLQRDAKTPLSRQQQQQQWWRLQEVDFLEEAIPGHCADIIAGDPSVPHSRPFMAALIRGNSFMCGGTLIRRNWVLTAAHCEIGKGDTVILGVHSLSNPEREKQTFQITNVYMHPKFNRTTMENDIMVLQLNRNAKLNRFVQTIRLPRTYEDVRAGTQCLVAGWGLTENGREVSDTLHEVSVTVTDRRICNDKEHYNSKPAVTMNMVCAGGINNQRNDTCNGDSGGPLICRGIQRGITSFGEPKKCGYPQFPGVYTRLTKDYVEWVKKETERR